MRSAHSRRSSSRPPPARVLKTHSSTWRSRRSRPIVQPDDDGDQHARARVEPGHLPAEEAEEQHDRHLVHHRRRDQERERHAERHAGGDEPDEQRHGRARAERRDDAQQGRQHVARRLALAGQDAARALRREERPDDADAEHDEHEQHQHLRRLEDEELDGEAEVSPPVETDDPVRHPGGKRLQVPVGGDPHDDRRRAGGEVSSKAWVNATVGRGGCRHGQSTIASPMRRLQARDASRAPSASRNTASGTPATR